MKRYDLSKLMKAAHRTYKYINSKKGISWAETLKSAWRMVKLSLSIEVGNKARVEKFHADMKERAANRPKATIEKFYPASDIALYGVNNSYRGGRFVND